MQEYRRGISSRSGRAESLPGMLSGMSLVVLAALAAPVLAAGEPEAMSGHQAAQEHGDAEGHPGAGTAAEGSAHELEDETSAVLVVGAAAETGASGGSGVYGASIGLEFPVIEDWLEIETGAAALANSPRREIGFDLTFKKPFRIGEHTEMMLGAGPFVTRASDSGGSRMLHGWEVVADFQFWTSRTGGWYVEPVWSRATETGERTWGINVGWLFGAHD